jgi:hypothetical protein
MRMTTKSVLCLCAENEEEDKKPWKTSVARKRKLSASTDASQPAMKYQGNTVILYSYCFVKGFLPDTSQRLLRNDFVYKQTRCVKYNVITFLNNYCISRPIRHTYFSKKCDLNSTCVLFAKGKCYFQSYK